MAHFSIDMSETTGASLQRYLERANAIGGLDAFVEQAVMEKIFRQTVRDVQERIAAVPAGDMELSINEAVEAVRAPLGS